MIIRPRFSRLAGAIAAMSLRAGGVSPEPLCMNLSYRVGDAAENVDRNRKAFCDAACVPVEALAIPCQVHGSEIRLIESAGAYPDCDGLLTDRGGVFPVVSVADCVPILLVDPRRRVAGAIHAGWRGTAAGTLGLAVDRCVAEFGCRLSDLFVWIGPAAGACCYEVGEDVASAFSTRFLKDIGGKCHVDLKQANYDQLVERGVPSEQIDIHPSCTIHNPEFHSFRRDGRKSGRMMAVVGWTLEV
jgi:YfiH family protein